MQNNLQQLRESVENLDKSFTTYLNEIDDIRFAARDIAAEIQKLEQNLSN